MATGLKLVSGSQKALDNLSFAPNPGVTFGSQSPSATTPTTPKQTYVNTRAATTSPTTSSLKTPSAQISGEEYLKKYGSVPYSGSDYLTKMFDNPAVPKVAATPSVSTPSSNLAPVTAPKTPYINPLTQPNYVSAKDTYLKSLAPSKGVKTAQEEYADLVASRDLGVAGIRNKPIPMEFITGQSRAVQELAEPKLSRAQNQVAIEQEAQKMQQEVAKAIFDIEQGNIDAYKPFNIGDSVVQFNPETGEIVELYTAPKTAEPTANQRDYEYAKAQGYQGTFLDFQKEQALLNPSAYQSVTDAFGNTSIINKLDPTGGARTDRHNNPTAFTTDIAKQAGLIEGVDYVKGDAFPDNPKLFTAALLGDPVATTIKVIDKLGFYTGSGQPRWAYIAQIPGVNNWANLDYAGKANIISQMYQQEGGNGSLGGGANSAAALYNSVKANPYAQISQPQRDAINNYAIQNGLPVLSGQPTDTQSQAAGFATRIAEANRIFDTLAPTVTKYSPAQLFAYQQISNQSGIGGLLNQFVPPEAQQQLQAQRNFINAILRRESGAAISIGEFTSNGQLYFPQPGDKPEVLSQKKIARDIALQNLINGSGGAYLGGQPNSAIDFSQYNFKL